jgi:hypothetical protein
MTLRFAFTMELTRLLFVRHREAVHAPRFRVWIPFGWLNESAADPETFAPPDANDFVANARIRTSAPSLLVYRCVAFAGNLPECESIAPKLFRQWPVVAFLTPTLRPRTRFAGRPSLPGALLFCRRAHSLALIVAPDSRNASRSLLRTRQNFPVGLRARSRPVFTARSR